MYISEGNSKIQVYLSSLAKGGAPRRKEKHRGHAWLAKMQSINSKPIYPGEAEFTESKLIFRGEAEFTEIKLISNGGAEFTESKLIYPGDAEFTESKLIYPGESLPRENRIVQVEMESC